MKGRLSRVKLLILSAVLSIFAGCRLYNLERRLGAENEDFLSKARYIINGEERRTFLLLPDSEKAPFIEDFWKRRDPDSATGDNEFKNEYFNRLERATHLFIGEGRPGWLTDRGRIYILFGPPMDRFTQPVGGDAASRCREVWYYGSFPVVFNDSSCRGVYELETYDLSSLRDLNLMYMQELNKAQAEAQRTTTQEQKPFESGANLHITVREAGRIEGVVHVEVPTKSVWSESEGKWQRTRLQIVLELRDSKKILVWRRQQGFDINLEGVELEEKTEKPLILDIPFVIRDEEMIRPPGRGPALLSITLTHPAGNEVLRKTMELK